MTLPWLKSPSDHGYVHPEGTARNGVLILGEAGEREEARRGKPFQGQAGMQLIQKTFPVYGFRREDFAFHNCLPCQPPGDWLEGAPWEEEATEHYKDSVSEWICNLGPRVIVPVGNIPLRWLLPDLNYAYQFRGKERTRGISHFRGYVYRSSKFDCFVVPTFHPSFLARGEQRFTQVQALDIRRAVKVAREGYSPPKADYIEEATLETGRRFVAEAREWFRVNPGAMLVSDIETEETSNVEEDEYSEGSAEIRRISFAFRPGYAISFLWLREFIPMIQELLLMGGWLAFWNADFDAGVLRDKGMMLNPKILDLMWLFHWLQSDLLKRLSFAGSLFTEMEEWKSFSQERPGWYSCCDADGELQVGLKIAELLRKEGRYDRFFTHCIKLDGLLKRMSKIGVKQDQGERIKFIQSVLKDVVEAEMKLKSLIPQEVLKTKVYKSIPKAARSHLKTCTYPESSSSFRGSLSEREGEYFYAGGLWHFREDFNLGSPHQVRAYMKFRGHTIPLNRKTRRETTGKDEMKSLAIRYPSDPLYKAISEIRSTRSILNNDREPDADGIIRCHLTHSPSTWRIAAENPPIMNISKRSRYSRAYRKQFVAREGCVLIEPDWKGIEACIVGYLAGDEDYVRLTRLGIHAVLASHAIGSPIPVDWPDEEIAKAAQDIKRSKPKLYAASKEVVYLSNYGGKPPTIKKRNPDLFEAERDARVLQDLYFDTLAKKIRLWQKATLVTANKQKYLDTVFQARHYFWDVLKWNGSMGTDAFRALAFMGQGTAAGVLKEAMLRIDDLGFGDFLRWPIHDALVAEAEITSAQPLALILKREMERPIPELGGLVIKVELVVGRNWGEMVEWDPAKEDIQNVLGRA